MRSINLIEPSNDDSSRPSSDNSSRKKGCREYLINRWNKSNVFKIYTGAGIKVEDIDTAVNTLTLVDALLLTIPFASFGLLNSSYWDWLYNLPCNNANGSYLGDYYMFYYDNVIQQLWITTISSVTGISIAVFYYLLRPSDNTEFLLWWSHGKYPFCFMLIFCTICVIAVLSTAGWFLNGWYVVGSEQFCLSPGWIPSSVKTLTIGYVTLGIAVIVSIILMF